MAQVDDKKRIRDLEGALARLQAGGGGRRTMADPDVTADVEAPVVEQIKKNATPIVTIIVALLLGGGAGAGSGLLRAQDPVDVEGRCRAIIASQSGQYARQTDVVELSTKMDLMTESFREMRDEFRELRRRPTP